MKNLQFVFNLIWKLGEGIFYMIVGLLGLFWFGGWMAIAPIQILGIYMEGSVPLWGFIALEAFWIVPALIWGYIHIMEYWMNFSKEYDERKG
jgi:hypothetical protein